MREVLDRAGRDEANGVAVGGERMGRASSGWGELPVSEAPATVAQLPRELKPGVYWLGECLGVPYGETMLHAYSSVYLIAGDRDSALVEGGHPHDLEVLDGQLEELFAVGVPVPRYLFATHTETPHCAGFGRILARFPEAEVVGDVTDLHLISPEYADRMRPLAPGDSIDLGGTELRVVEAVFRDFIHTRWAFDTRSRVLFTGDGLAYSHYHEAGQCARVAEEVPELDLPDMTALFSELAFYWTRFNDIEPYIARLDALVFDELEAVAIAPTHGLPVMDPKATLPLVREGLRISANTALDKI